MEVVRSLRFIAKLPLCTRRSLFPAKSIQSIDLDRRRRLRRRRRHRCIRLGGGFSGGGGGFSSGGGGPNKGTTNKGRSSFGPADTLY